MLLHEARPDSERFSSNVNVVILLVITDCPFSEVINHLPGNVCFIKLAVLLQANKAKEIIITIINCFMLIWLFLQY